MRLFFLLFFFSFLFLKFSFAFNPLNILPTSLSDLHNNEFQLITKFENVKNINLLNLNISYNYNNFFKQSKDRQNVNINFTDKKIELFIKPFNKTLYFTYNGFASKFFSDLSSDKYNTNFKIKNNNFNNFGFGFFNDYCNSLLIKNFEDHKNSFSNFLSSVNYKDYFSIIFFKNNNLNNSEFFLNYKQEKLNFKSEFINKNSGLKSILNIKSFCKLDYFYKKDFLNDDISEFEKKNKFNTLLNGESKNYIYNFELFLLQNFSAGFENSKFNSNLFSKLFEKENVNNKIINFFIKTSKEQNGIFFKWNYSKFYLQNFFLLTINKLTASSYGSGYFDASYYIDFFLNVMAGDRTGYFNIDYECNNVKIVWNKTAKKFSFQPIFDFYDFSKFRLFYDYYEPLLGGFIIKKRKTEIKDYEKLIFVDLICNANYLLNKQTSINLQIAQLLPIIIKEKKINTNNQQPPITSATTEFAENKIYGGFRLFIEIQYKI